MFGSSVLEIAIGVIFVYLVLSLICTAVNEAIATLLNKRGKNLFEGIKNMLNDPTFTGLAQQIYNHGLIDGISQDTTISNKPTRRPSYLPTKTFSLALLDILSANGVVSAAHGDALTKAEQADDEYQKLISVAGADMNDPAIVAAKAAAAQGRTNLLTAQTNAKKAYDDKVTAGGATPTEEQLKAIAAAKTASDTAEAAVRILDARRAAVDSANNPKDAALISKAADTLEQSLVLGRAVVAGLPHIDDIQTAVNRLPDGHTKESLLVLIDKAKREITDLEDAVKRFQHNIEGWFNDSMDRVGGWYKRWTQKVLIVFAVLVVLLLNADTIMLIKTFSSDKDMRAAILAKAEKADLTISAADVSDPTKSGALARQLEAESLPLGWSSDKNNRSRRFPWQITEAEKLDSDKRPLSVAEVNFKLAGQILLKLLGLLISIGAISLGAPFWFDMLSKFINIRGAGTPPGEKKKSAGATV
ncbi:MAG TPA: hypothetical protein VGC91_10735 [Pyrinomonadaceae bacterium]|jgi:hypothetical protein